MLDKSGLSAFALDELPRLSQSIHRVPCSLPLAFHRSVPHLGPEERGLTEPLLTYCCAASVQHSSASHNDVMTSFVSAEGSLDLGFDMLLCWTAGRAGAEQDPVGLPRASHNQCR